jgi:hypothetical protein
MKKFLVAAFALFTFAAAYIAAPFVTVWSVREAIRNGDAAYLDEKMEWPTVRASLRESLTDYAIGPTPVALPGQPVEQPGFWKRVKNGLSRRAVDNMVESYVTPEGLPQLFGMRQFYRENISSEANAAPLPWHQRAYGFWSRIKRAVFHSSAVFEVEIADRNDPTRHYIAHLKLRGVAWKVTELRVRTVAPAENPA